MDKRDKANEKIVDLAAHIHRKAAEGADSAALADELKAALFADGQETQAAILLRIADEADIELAHTSDRTAFARIDVGNHREVHSVRSRSFRGRLTGLYFEETGKPPSREAMSGAIDVLAARAEFKGEEIEIAVRVAWHDGRIYVDLANPGWQAVCISPDGFSVVNDPPVWFRRAPGMLALPEPVKGGSVDLLYPFLNLRDPRDRTLVVAWLIAAFIPPSRIQYPVLIFQGPQGSAKSTAERLHRLLVDPSASLIRVAPKEARDLVIAATNSHVVAYDNLSGLPVWLSDAICRLATGGGLSTRLLYTDDEERIFDVKRPVLLNGIDDCATRQDLIDRAIVIALEEIPEDKRREESVLLAEFDRVRPKIIGAIFSALACALRTYDSVSLARKPRLADFARWVTAAGPALGWDDETFMTAFTASRKDAVEAGLEADPVAIAVRSLMEGKDTWVGPASRLFKELSEKEPEQTKSPSWPKAANTLSSRLVGYLAGPLRNVGLQVTRAKKQADGKRPISIVRLDSQLREKTAVIAGTAVNGAESAQRNDRSDGDTYGDPSAVPERTAVGLPGNGDTLPATAILAGVSPSREPAPILHHGSNGSYGDTFANSPVGQDEGRLGEVAEV